MKTKPLGAPSMGIRIFLDAFKWQRNALRHDWHDFPIKKNSVIQSTSLMAETAHGWRVTIFAVKCLPIS